MSGAVERVLNDRYELRQHAARGGMADVYHGWDRRLSREIAIKVLRPELSADDDYVDRFRDEARTAARLVHPNIVSVYDTGTDQTDAYMVMEWVDGPTLAQVIREDAPLSVERACRIGAEIAAGLQYAHEQGVTNRDVKSSNVLLSTTTGNAKVTDFGIAKVPERSTVETLPGVVLGTPAYLSPEQLRGQPADARSDVYGLGAVLYEMVTGRKPFVGDTPAEVAGNALHRRPPRPSTINPQVPPAFEAILQRALARDPDDRYQSAAELRADLLDCERGVPTPGIDETVALAADADGTRAFTTVEPVPAATPPPRRRRTAEAWLIGVVLALAVLAVVIALLASNRNSKTPTTTVPTTTPTTATTLAPTTIRTVPRTTRPLTVPTTETPTVPPTQTPTTFPTPTFTFPTTPTPTS